MADATVELLLNFLVAQRGDRAVSVAQLSSALHVARQRAGGAALDNNFLWRRFRRGDRKQFPSGRTRLGLIPFAPFRLVLALPLQSRRFEDVRLCAIVLLRIVTMIRGGAVASIKRSSIECFRDPLNRGVVGFHFRSKNANNFGMAVDSNYVEFLSASVPLARRLVLCPAERLLQLKSLVEGLPQAQRHDALFTDQFGAPLSVDSCRRVVRNFMSSVPNVDARHRSHALRSASSQMLALLGVPIEDICTRAGWVTKATSATRLEHYISFRLVRHNFANLLLSWPPVVEDLPSVDVGLMGVSEEFNL